MRISGKSAQVLGLKERGEIREGWHADINVIDYAELRSCHPECVRDFPHNGGPDVRVRPGRTRV